MLKEKLKKYLNENDFDYLLINSTNEFLAEYNDLQSNSRYHLTGFSGSAGDALMCKNGEIFLFVDGRYHKQADNQVDNGVTVVKLALGETFLSAMVEKLQKNTKIALVSGKISLNFYKNLQKYLGEKNIKSIELDYDPAAWLIAPQKRQDSAIFDIGCEIAGKTSEEKVMSIQKKLGENEILMLTNLEEIAYLTNKRSFSQNFSSTFKAKMLIEKNNFKLFLEDELELFYETISNTDKTVLYTPKSLTLKDFRLIERSAKELKINWVENTKAVKNSKEIKHLKNCFKRTDKVIEAVCDYIKNAKNLTEQELSNLVEAEFLRQGAKSLSFNTILASGKNSALAHYSTDMNAKTPIKKGDLILLDCGGYFEGGYATDITRVFCFGEPSNEQKHLYTTVLKAFLNAFHIKKGKISGFDIDKKARDTINKNAVEGFSFNHATGHGVGISVHEYPPSISMSDLAKTPLKTGMVFTIEPGCYNPDFGGVRLENTVYLSRQGIKSLSKAGFEENLIDYGMLNEKELAWLDKWQKSEV